MDVSEKRLSIVSFAVMAAGSNLAVRRVYLHRTPVEKAETVVTEGPEANNRSRRQRTDPFPDVPDRGKKVSLEALNDGPAGQVLPAGDLSLDGLDGALFNNAPRAGPRAGYPGEGPAATAHISIGAGEIWKGQEFAVDGPTEVGTAKLS